MRNFLHGLIGNVRQHHWPAWRLGSGIALRIIEKVLGALPYIVVFSWFATTHAGEPLRLTWLVGILLALLSLQCLAAYLGQLSCFLGAYDITMSYRERLYAGITRLPLGFFQQHRTGGIAASITDDAKRLEDSITHVLPDLIATLSLSIIFAGILAWFDWRLTLALLLPVPLALFCLNRLRHRFLAHGKRKHEQFADTSGLLVEYLSGLTTLRALNATQPWLRRLDQRFTDIQNSSLSVEAWAGGAVQLYRLLLELGIPLLLAGSAWLLQREEWQPGVLLLFAISVHKILTPLSDLAAHLTELRSLSLSAGRLRHLLEQPRMPEGDHQLKEVRGEIEFHDISFHYDSAWVLSRLSFHVPAGYMVALVGPSGAGKSTVLHLLARFFDPQRGTIRIDGHDSRGLKMSTLHGAMGFVFQDVQLFDGTLEENVRIGKPHASHDEVVAACRQACCDDFIRRLPAGYDTSIGENGHRLSGGERQRLSLARAFLKDAPILLLDEATASVDPDTQYELQQALSRLVRSRTVILVAHRLATIRYADRILVLSEGRLVEQGNHEELMQCSGLYAQMWQEQHPEAPL